MPQKLTASNIMSQKRACTNDAEWRRISLGAVGEGVGNNMALQLGPFHIKDTVNTIKTLQHSTLNNSRVLKADTKPRSSMHDTEIFRPSFAP